MILVDGIPRRIRLDHATPTEKAIRAAMAAVEGLDAHVRLTDAVVLLGKALDAVADYEDEKIEKAGEQ